MQSARRAAAAALLPARCLGPLCGAAWQICGHASQTGYFSQIECLQMQSHHAKDMRVQHTRQQQSGYSSDSAASAPSSKHLRDVLRLDLLQDKTADEVEHIWLTVSTCLLVCACITCSRCPWPLAAMQPPAGLVSQ